MLNKYLYDKFQVQKIQALTPNIGVVYRYYTFLVDVVFILFSYFGIGMHCDHFEVYYIVVEVMDLCCIFSIAKSISHTLHLGLFSVVWVQISVFWWEKAESRRNSIIGCTRYTFGKLFSLVPCNYFYIRVSLDLGKGRHNSIISREGLILGTYILKFLH